MFFLAAFLIVLAIVFFIATLNSYKYDHVYMLLTVVMLIASLMALDIAMSERSCTVTWNMSNTPSQYTIVTGCMIKINDKWIPARSYRELAD